MNLQFRLGPDWHHFLYNVFVHIASIAFFSNLFPILETVTMCSSRFTETVSTSRYWSQVYLNTQSLIICHRTGRPSVVLWYHSVCRESWQVCSRRLFQPHIRHRRHMKYAHEGHGWIFTEFIQSRSLSIKIANITRFRRPSHCSRPMVAKSAICERLY